MKVWIIKLIINAIIKKLNEKYNFNNIKEYVEEDNELDIKVKSIYKTNIKYGKYIEEMEKDIAQIKVVAHKPVDWLDKIKDLEKEIKVLKDVVSTSSSIKNKFKKIRR